MPEEDLVDAFAQALRNEPEPLDEVACLALARAAVAEVEAGEALVDALADALRAEEPPGVREVWAPIDAGEAGEPLSESRSESRSEPPSKPPAELPAEVPAPRSGPRLALRGGWYAAAAAATVVLAVGVGLWVQLLWPGNETPEITAPVVHRLAGGHEITASAESRLEIDEAGRRVRVGLSSGEALFDVAPGSDFVVRAAEVRVMVTGTVFTVGRRMEQVLVQVYEGSVRVESDGRTHVLRAGDRFGAGDWGDSRLAERARGAAHRRMAAADSPVVVASEAAPARGVAVSGRSEGGPSQLEPQSGPSSEFEPDVEAEPPSDSARPTPHDATGSPLPRGRPVDAAIREALIARRYSDALAMVDRALRLRRTYVRQMLRGDALRGLGRASDAVAAYRAAMRLGDPEERALAGLTGATLLADALQRPQDARAMLRASGALESRSPVRAAARRLDARLESR